VLVRPSRPAPRDGGFTLVELLVVIAILGILTAIAVPTFLSQRDKAHDAAVKQDLRAAATEVSAFFVSDERAAAVGATPGYYDLRLAAQQLGGLSVPTPTQGTVVEVRAFGGGEYCLRASSDKGATSGSPRTYFWYRSTSGMVSGDPTATTADC